MAPVVRTLDAHGDVFDVRVCLTAQHRELLDDVVAAFELRTHYDLDVMRPDQTIFDVTSAVITRMGEVIEEVGPDVVLVHGDTTTTFAASLAAYYNKAPVGHVEAGLRTYDKFRPFPEEMNRRITDVLCDYHYAPTEGARRNLIREGIPEEGIRVTGNTVIDALLQVAEKNYQFDDPLLEAAGRSGRLILVTAHRRESFGEPFRNMCAAMRDLARRNGDVEIVYPVHPNPKVRAVTEDVLAGQERVHLIEPLGYMPFVHLMKKAAIVLTDSGGIQEEAPALGKPVLVMREVTERPEAVEAGTAKLVGTSYENIVTEAQRLLDDDSAYAQMANAVNPYGDGKAGRRIAEHLVSIHWRGLG